MRSKIVVAPHLSHIARRKSPERAANSNLLFTQRYLGNQRQQRAKLEYIRGELPIEMMQVSFDQEGRIRVLEPEHFQHTEELSKESAQFVDSSCSKTSSARLIFCRNGDFLQISVVACRHPWLAG